MSSSNSLSHLPVLEDCGEQSFCLLSFTLITKCILSKDIDSFYQPGRDVLFPGALGPDFHREVRRERLLSYEDLLHHSDSNFNIRRLCHGEQSIFSISFKCQKHYTTALELSIALYYDTIEKFFSKNSKKKKYGIMMKKWEEFLEAEMKSPKPAKG